MPKLHDDRDWLYGEYVTKGRSLDDIAEETGASRPTISRRVSKFGIRKPYVDHDWLNEEYIVKNKTSYEIGRELGVDPSTIMRYVNRHGLTKEPDKEREARIRGLTASRETITCDTCGNDFRVRTTLYENKLGWGQEWFYCSRRCFCASGRETSIEKKVRLELESRGLKFLTQFSLNGKFTADFFLPDFGIVVECDGDYWHSLPEVVERDKRKDTYVSELGYELFRFNETEINEDVRKCVNTLFTKIVEREVV
jgi:very-short-patch-repair endonuclease